MKAFTENKFRGIPRHNFFFIFHSILTSNFQQATYDKIATLSIKPYFITSCSCSFFNIAYYGSITFPKPAAISQNTLPSNIPKNYISRFTRKKNLIFFFSRLDWIVSSRSLLGLLPPNLIIAYPPCSYISHILPLLLPLQHNKSESKSHHGHQNTTLNSTSIF